jgi:hypothetical protein
MNQKLRGNTPMTSRVAPSIVRRRPDDGGIAAESPLPVAVAEHHDVRTALGVVALGEGTSERRLHAEQRQQTERREQAVHALRQLIASHGGRRARPDGDVGERLRVLAVGDVVRDGGIEIVDVDARCFLPETHEPIRPGKGQRAEQDAVDDAENRGVRADAQCQREQRREREQRRAHEPAGGVPRVAQELGHDGRTRQDRRSCTAASSAPDAAKCHTSAPRAS